MEALFFWGEIKGSLILDSLILAALNWHQKIKNLNGTRGIKHMAQN